MSDFKKAFDAGRVYHEHTLKQAAETLGVSETFLIMFLQDKATSAPLEKKIRDYIYTAGIINSIKKLGLDPDSKVKTLSA